MHFCCSKSRLNHKVKNTKLKLRQIKAFLYNSNFCGYKVVDLCNRLTPFVHLHPASETQGCEGISTIMPPRQWSRPQCQLSPCVLAELTELCAAIGKQHWTGSGRVIVSVLEKLKSNCKTRQRWLNMTPNPVHLLFFHLKRFQKHFSVLLSYNMVSFVTSWLSYDFLSPSTAQLTVRHWWVGVFAGQLQSSTFWIL